MTEKVLSYSREPFGDYDGGVRQTRPWDCGPASCQVLLQSAGIVKSEQWLIDQIGTTVDGTNSADCIIPVLNRLLPGSGYISTWLSREPVTKAQIDQLWADVSKSIAGNRGVILNFEAPPGRGPKGSRGSVSPPYPTTQTCYHYVAGMGVAQDPDGSRHIWVADPAGFGGITGYWCPVEDIARLIVPHAYAFAATVKPVDVPPPPPAPTPLPPPAPAPKPKPDPIAIIVQSDWDKSWRSHLEWSAIEFGDPAAVAAIVKAAQIDARGKAALAKLEARNPAALQAFINAKG